MRGRKHSTAHIQDSQAKKPETPPPRQRKDLSHSRQMKGHALFILRLSPAVLLPVSLPYRRATLVHSYLKNILRDFHLHELCIRH